MTDARFEDADEAPLALAAEDTDDLRVMAALVQDAVFAASDIRYDGKRREFALLINRFRWEDREAAERAGRGYERVRSVLMFRDVMAVQSQFVPQGDADTVLSLLDIAFTAGEDGTGRVELTLAGDGAIGMQVEALNVVLRDVTRPYLAPSRKVPQHRD